MANNQFIQRMDIDVPVQEENNTKVTAKDVPDLVKLLMECSLTGRNKVRLAHALELNSTFVNDLEADVTLRRTGTPDFFGEMLRKWISTDSDNTFGKLIRTLKGIESNSVAEKIATKYANSELC